MKNILIKIKTGRRLEPAEEKSRELEDELEEHNTDRQRDGKCKRQIKQHIA